MDNMMKRKTLFKCIIGILISICFMVVCDHMPQLLPTVYDSIFKVVSFPMFMFLAGIFICEFIVLKKYANKKQHYYIIFGAIFALSSMTLFNGHASLYDKLTPGSNTTLLTRPVANTDLSMAVFIQYYMDDKKVVVPEEIANFKEDSPYIFTFSVNPNNIRIDEKENISKHVRDTLLSYPYCSDGKFFYVIDEYWKKTDTIRLVFNNDKWIFCSQEILDAIGEEDDYKGIVLEENGGLDEASLIIRDMEFSRPYKKIRQIIVMSLLFAIGMIITLPILGERYPILAVFLSLPISAASLCICGMVMMLFNIPYNIYSIFVCCILLLGTWTYKKRNTYKRLEWPEISNYILMAIGIIIVFAYAEICYTTHDSIVKCALGYRLAKYGSLYDILDYAAPYGMLEPMIMSLGYMVHCDLLYTFYPLMIICGIGLMCASLYYINNKKYKEFSMVVLFGGIVLLLSNYDFALSAFYVMAHGPIAVYMLIFIMFIILKRQINIQGFEYVVILSASMILLTRVEGAIYVQFILIASMGIENEYLKLKRANIILPSIIILWNVYQIIYIGQSISTLFWTSTRGFLLIGTSIITIIYTICFNQSWMVWKYIKKNYYCLLLIIIAGGTAFASLFMERGMASLNLPVYLAHFSNSLENDTNSAALWIFICLLFLVILSKGDTIDKYTVIIVLGYLALVYVVCLFRYEGSVQVPLKLRYSDSSRRTIVQIMPTAVWLIAYCIGEAKEFINKRVKN